MSTHSPTIAPTVDVAVVGAGFGGLASALHLVESGASVALFEALKYPGGCASTFEKGGARYETGATLFSGLGERGLFERWRQRHDMDVRFDLIDVPVELRAPGLALPVSRHRDRFVDAMCALPGAPVPALRAFFREQGRVADALWPVLDDAERLPPLSPAGLGFHAGRAHRYLPALRWMTASALDVARRYGVQDFRPLRTWMDAICQITVQADAASAEAPFALSTMDYLFRGTGHVHGGIGELAWAMARAVERAGGELRLADRVRGLRRDGADWIVDARGGTVRARHVVANVLPGVVSGMLEAPDVALDRLQGPVDDGWGAVMLYLQVARDAALRPEPHHLELVADTSAPFVEGNHVFCSISGVDEGDRAPGGRRTVTVSTHLAIERLRGRPPAEHGQRVASIQARMRQTIRQLAPALDAAVVHELTASPRTWQRFTRRPEGLVGGVPRRAGLANYRGIWPRPVQRGLWLVGDSVFPGQSTLATALGGVRTARALLRAS